ncbi:Co2+/Mg2+ efflux protein ApaG [Thaumasiovibrio sp. DFM-14]|uniref:Co2+/Mg2+ efflux protein ApaG n=1 Tax=Thaumasiovibrio sp. DFM-14 TaxID=3384792 RepID=UPI0039A0BD3F
MQTFPQVKIQIVSHFETNQPAPTTQHYAFSYTITIDNIGQYPIQLLRRRWLITDANGKQMHVEGDGVIGQQPHIAPGEQFQYTSGTLIETEVGVMQGFYIFADHLGQEHQIEIPTFRLAVSNILH